MANDAPKLNDDPRKAEQEVEDRFKQRLLELGLLTEITPRLSPDAFPEDRQLSPVQGNAVSELLMRERR